MARQRCAQGRLIIALASPEDSTSKRKNHKSLAGNHDRLPAAELNPLGTFPHTFLTEGWDGYANVFDDWQHRPHPKLIQQIGIVNIKREQVLLESYMGFVMLQ